MIGHTGTTTIKRFFVIATILTILLLVGCEGVIEFEYSNASDSIPEDSLSKGSIKKYYDYNNNVTCYVAYTGVSCIEGLRNWVRKNKR